MSVLLPKLKPLLYANGGPIISVQVVKTIFAERSSNKCKNKVTKKHTHSMVAF